MAIQKRFLDGAVTIADLAQHPPHSLVDQILAIIQQHLRNGERVAKVALPDVMKRRDDGDPPVPQIAAPREPAKLRAVSVEQMRAQDVRSGAVDEIPVVDAPARAEVQRRDRGAFARTGAPISTHQDEQREHPRLVPGRLKQTRGLTQGERVRLSREAPQRRNAESEKAVPFAVLARTRLEERLQRRGTHRVPFPLQPPLDIAISDPGFAISDSSLR